MLDSIKDFWREIQNYWGFMFDYFRYNVIFILLFIILSALPPLLVNLLEDTFRSMGISMLNILIIYVVALIPMSFFGYIINSSILYFMETYEDPSAIGFSDVKVTLDTINKGYLSLKVFIKISFAMNMPILILFIIIFFLLVSGLGVFGLVLGALLLLLIFYILSSNSFIYPILFLANSEYNYQQLHQISKQINQKEFLTILPKIIMGVLPTVILMFGIHTLQLLTTSIALKVLILMIGFSIFKIGYLFILMVVFNVYMEEWATKHFN